MRKRVHARVGRGEGGYLVHLVVILRVVFVDLFLFREDKVPGESSGRQRVSTMRNVATYLTMSSTSKSFLHCSAESSIALVLATSNLRARRNLRGSAV